MRRSTALLARQLTVCAVLASALLPLGGIASAAPSGPVALAPNGTSAEGSPTLTWSRPTGAAKYKLQVATNPSYTSPVVNVTTEQERYDIPAPLPTGPVYWRVQSVDSGGSTSDWVGASFTRDNLGVPVPSSPPNGAGLAFPQQPVVFAWSAVQSAQSYTVEVDDAPDFIGATSYSTKVSSLVLNDVQTAGQTSYWRVRAVFGTGVVSEPSPAQSYTVVALPAPTNLSPPRALAPIVTDVVLQWDPVPGAAKYQLQVSLNDAFTNNVVLDTQIMSTRFSPPTTFNNDDYFWRVRGIDVDGDFGAWSAPQESVHQFRRAWPLAPTLTYPADGVGTPVHTLYYEWTPVPWASSYRLELADSGTFSHILKSCTTTHTTYVPSTSADCVPAPGQITYWRVRAFDEPKPVNSLYSEARVFVYDPEATEPVQLLGPANDSAVPVPTLSWQSISSVAKYKVTIKNKDDGVAKSITTLAASWTPDSLLDPADGPFTWYVQAVREDGTTSPIPPRGSWWSFQLAGTAPGGSTPDSTVSSTTAVRSPALSWKAVPGTQFYRIFVEPLAAGYEVQVGGDLKYPALTFTGESAGGASLLAPGEYRWRVEAHASAGSWVDSTASYTYTIAEPGTVGGQRVALNATTAIDGTSPEVCTAALLIDDSLCTDLTDTPVLAWEHVADAGFYRIYLSADRAMTNILATYRTESNFFIPNVSLKDSQAGTAYYWFVEPCVTSAQCGGIRPAGHAFEKRANPISLVSPSNGAQVSDQVTFSWQDFLATNNQAGFTGSAGPAPTQEAKQYRIQVSTVADFATTIDTAVVDQTTYTAVNKTYPEGPLYWRVQPIDGSDNSLTWSATGLAQKTSGIPLPLSPSQPPAASNATPYFRWQPTAYAARYDVEVYKNDDVTFSPANKVLSASVEQAAYAPTSTLPTGPAQYQWRVRRIDAGGNAGRWSSMPPFTITGTPPTQLDPVNGAFGAGRDVTFTWTQVPGASRYRVEWNSSPNSGGRSQDTVGLAWSPTERLGNGTWFWRVTSLDPSGAPIGATGWRSMTVDGTSPTIVAKGATANVAPKGPITISFSEPVLGLDASSLQLVLGQNNVVPAAVSASADGRAATIVPVSPLVPGQTYTIRVSSAVHDPAGNALPAASWAIRATTSIQNDAPAVVETWDRDSAPTALGRGYAESRQAGDRAVLRFTGTAVSLVGRLARDGGYGYVRLDGGKAVRVSFYAPTTRDQRQVFARSRLVNKVHTLEVTVAGTRPAGATSTFVRLDAARVGRSVIDDRSSAWSTFFRRVRTSLASGLSYDTTLLDLHGDTGTKPSYKASFVGRTVTIYAITGPTSGLAQVSIDGIAQPKLVDLYSTRPARTKVFSKSLTNRAHTVLIVVTGAKRSAAKGTSVSLDYVSTS